MFPPVLQPYDHDERLDELYELFFGGVDGDGDGEAWLPSAGPDSFASPAHREHWLERQAKAGAQVRVMVNRGSCPLAIEMTSTCLTALTCDLRHDDGPSAQLLYSMAIVRFVNGVVDEFQNGVFAESISMLASKIGLPLWLVELRHAATHQKLPSLQALREANLTALQWLLKGFWMPSLTSAAGIAEHRHADTEQTLHGIRTMEERLRRSPGVTTTSAPSGWSHHPTGLARPLGST